MIYDVFTYNGEADILDIRFNILYPIVDQFIIVEATETFSGKPKPLYWAERGDRFEEFEDKVKYHVIDNNYTQEELELAYSSPNTQGAEHWKREFCQKESIKKALAHLQDDDIVFIGDCDELWDISARYNDEPLKLKLRVYSYWLNNRSSEEFWGTLRAKYKDIKNECLNHLRINTKKGLSEYGWHFTSLGGYEEVKRKLSNSYTEESYWNSDVQANLEENMASNKDFLGRDFTYRTDESEWPQFLKDNRQRYKHLLR